MKDSENNQSPGPNARESSLDISDEAMGKLSSQAVALVADYFARVSELPVFPDTSGGDTVRRLGSDLPVEGEPIEKLFNDVRAIIDGSRHNGHPRFFGYVASPATPPGAFADLIASALNSSCGSCSAHTATRCARSHPGAPVRFLSRGLAGRSGVRWRNKLRRASRPSIPRRCPACRTAPARWV